MKLPGRVLAPVASLHREKVDPIQRKEGTISMSCTVHKFHLGAAGIDADSFLRGGLADKLDGTIKANGGGKMTCSCYCHLLSFHAIKKMSKTDKDSCGYDLPGNCGANWICILEWSKGRN